MKKLIFDRTKLTAYSSIAAALFATEKSNAQIVYTDIEPNATLDNPHAPTYASEMIDMNNDGIADFDITSDLFINSYSNDVLVIKAYAEAHRDKIANSAIGYWGCRCSVEGFNYGDIIGSNHPDQLWRFEGYLFFPSGSNYWVDGQEHYLGGRLKFRDTTTHYGWVRMKVRAGHSVEIMDYAYNSIPNQPIAAGQTLPCSDPFESNNNFATAKSVQTGYIYHGLIDVATDEDFFKWTYTADSLKPNVQISLLNLPKNYNLRLYNSDLNQIAISKNTGLADEKIFYNGTLPSGKYFIKVYPKNATDIDPANCYSLQIESRSTPYPRIATSEIPVSERTSVKVFPNPAADHITFLRTRGVIAELRVMDISGRVIITSSPVTEQASVAIDISDLPGGTYFARITGPDDVIVTKFIVQK